MSTCDSTTCKRNPSCGCPECSVSLNCDPCCRCIPRTLCVRVITDYDECGNEFDYDPEDRSFSGRVNCGGVSYDFYFWLDREPDNGACFLGLRSKQLGFPEGYEYKFYLSQEYGENAVTCELIGSLDVDGITIAFGPPEKWKPLNCTGCKCLCECLCMTVTRADGALCSGKLCWDYESNAWTGEVICGEHAYDEVRYTARVEFHPRGDFCDEIDDPYCDACDPRCILVLQIPELGIVDAIRESLSDPCEERNLSYSWQFQTGDDTEHELIDVRISCAKCLQRCGSANFCCFQPGFAPPVLHVTYGRFSGEGTCLTNYGDYQTPLPEVGMQGGGPIVWSRMPGEGIYGKYVGWMSATHPTYYLSEPNDSGSPCGTYFRDFDSSHVFCIQCDLGVEDRIFNLKWADSYYGWNGSSCPNGIQPGWEGIPPLLEFIVDQTPDNVCENLPAIPYRHPNPNQFYYYICCDPLIVYVEFNAGFIAPNPLMSGGWMLITE